jgi:hypothetical protein
MIKTVGAVALAILMLDALAFFAWVLSGQTPADGFYFGAITANIIKALLAL